MSPTDRAVVVAAHQTVALADILALVDAGLTGRERPTDVLLDIRLRASQELNTAVKEAPPWTRP